MSSADSSNQSEFEGSDVFLSYSRDNQPLARKILDLLEEAGFSVWWDAMLEGGVRFHEVTEGNLENAAAVVVLWSEISVKSHWVHDEATRGRDRGCLIPVSIDGTLPPLGFRQFQWINVSQGDWTLHDPEVAKLIAAVKARREAEETPEDRGGSEQAAAGESAAIESEAIATRAPLNNPNRRMALLAGGAALLASAGGVWAWNTVLLGGAGSGSNRLAVLPFETMGESDENLYLLNGFASSIRSELARNPLLHVAAKTSSEALANSGETARVICERLGVDFLLTGSLNLAAERIQVRGELIEGSNDRQVLPVAQDVPVESVLAVQAQIASDVIRELNAQANAASTTQLGGTESVAAYDAFLRGQELYDSGLNEASDRAALAKFDEAIELDPDYAAALAMRSRTLALIGNLYGAAEDHDAIYGAALQSAESAVSIAPEFALGHSVLGFVRASRFLDMKAAEEPYERSYQLGRGDSDVLSRYSIFRTRLRDFAGAGAAILAAEQLDPFNPRVHRYKGDLAYADGLYAEAIAAFDKGWNLQEGMSSYHYLVGLSRLELGELASAKEAFASERRFVFGKTGLAIVEHKLGNIAGAQTHFAELQERQGDKSHYQYMQVQAQWGEAEAALDALDAAWTQRDSGLVQMHSDPLLAPIREMERFKALEQQMGFV